MEIPILIFMGFDGILGSINLTPATVARLGLVDGKDLRDHYCVPNPFCGQSISPAMEHSCMCAYMCVIYLLSREHGVLNGSRVTLDSWWYDPREVAAAGDGDCGKREYTCSAVLE